MVVDPLVVVVDNGVKALEEVVEERKSSENSNSDRVDRKVKKMKR